jgi:hypothetical protein
MLPIGVTVYLVCQQWMQRGDLAGARLGEG